MNVSDLITLTEAANVAGCARQWIAFLVREKKLRVTMVAGRPFVRRQDAAKIVVRKKLTRRTA